jgi:hypothetical protein
MVGYYARENTKNSVDDAEKYLKTKDLNFRNAAI